MNENKNIGVWMAIIENDGKAPQIIVDGNFPTNGQKPVFELKEKYPEGINSSELILILLFGSLVTPLGKATGFVHYQKPIAAVNQYETVLVLDDEDRKIANINIALPNGEAKKKPAQKENEGNHVGDIQGGVH